MTRNTARPRTAGRRAHAPGFSLIEILAVVFIIGVLAAIGGIGYAKMREQSQVRTTMTAMQQLLNVAEAYRVQTKQDIRNDNETALPSIESFVKQARQLPEVESVLVTLSASHLVMGTEAGNPVPVSVTDAWGTPLIYRNLDDNDVPTDIDDVLNANANALDTHRRPYFISAGPDRSFTDAADNIYSFNLD